jgi:hypothetical protein
VSFSEFMLDVPPPVRLLLAIAITVAVTVLCVRVFHSEILRLNTAPKKENDDDPDPPPGIKDLSGRLIALATFAFVFLLGFAFGQFWGTAKDGRDAVLSEATHYQRAVGLAEQLPDEQSAVVVKALDDYRQSVVDVEWPLMVNADSNGLVQARYDSGGALADAILSVLPADASSNPVWTNLESSIDDLLDDAVDRTNAIPSPMAVSIIVLVFVLGLTNLVAIALFQPSTRKANLLVIASMAALTAFLLFVLVEISNPYTGAGAITSELMQR